jgi:molybdopterin molybdotransferase
MLLSEQETLDRVLKSVGQLGTVNVSIWEAGNRVLAEEIVATVALPRFDNSTVDGYAVSSHEAVTGAKLAIAGEQPAGADQGLNLGRGEAIRIFTGAPIPKDADAVVMQEDVDPSEKCILVREGVSRGENIRVRGGDLCDGQTIARHGALLNPPILAAIASQGLRELRVFERPRVAVIATGSELRSPGESLRPGEIYETNRLLVAQLVEASGATAEVFDIVPDTEEAHLQSFDRARGYDAIAVAGGVSVGAKDLVKPILQRLGATLELWRVSIKPGKPFMFGRIGSTPIFGLPGNPVSAFVTFLLFARPALWKLGGRTELALPRATARLVEKLVNRGDRPHYIRGIYVGGTFRPVGRQESHALYALSQANALCRVEPDQTIAAESYVDVIPV